MDGALTERRPLTTWERPPCADTDPQGPQCLGPHAGSQRREEVHGLGRPRAEDGSGCPSKPARPVSAAERERGQWMSTNLPAVGSGCKVARPVMGSG